ncbi:MAG TPA: DNA-binding domain-containing protein [Polyangiaceae bacterium]|nr:DNA-binding domain-containing protein [Polyangiaceae bacterium]
MNREVTPDALGLHERASATPQGADPTQRFALGQAPSWTEDKLGLRAQQEWFLAIVSTPQDEPAPVDERSAPRLIAPSATLTSLERIEIYRRGYHARLIECLVDDYPVLQHALGEEAFEALCRRYIARYPSHGPSLNYFGQHMAEFCRSEPLEMAVFAADLAALEWAIVLAIHAPTAEAFGFEDLSRVPSERFAGARFRVNPSLRILRLEYPVNEYLHAYRQGSPLPLPAAHPNRVAVYRTGRSVWRLELEPEIAILVESLASGATLETALAEVQTSLSLTRESEHATEQELANKISHCFRHSVSSGLFSAIFI